MKALLLTSAAALLLADIAVAQQTSQARPRPAPPPGSDITRDLNSLPGDPLGTTRPGPAAPPVIEDDEDEAAPPPRATVSSATPRPSASPTPRPGPPVEEREDSEDDDEPDAEEHAEGLVDEPSQPSFSRVTTPPPFRIDLPSGFELVQRLAPPGAAIYEARRGDRGFVAIYVGCCSQFPIYDGRQVQTGGRFSVVGADDGEQRALEHLFQSPDGRTQVHVWVQSVEGANRAVAEAIAQSVDPTGLGRP